MPALRSLKPLLLVAAVALFLMLEWIGGITYPLDVAAIRAGQQWRTVNPQSTGLIIFYTHLGSAPVLLTATAIGAGWLAWKRQQMARAVALIVTVLGARIGVEVIKLLVDRPRPGFETHPVVVHSQSFPSGHAGNSMATFLALALFLAPERWRRAAVALAIVASIAMGATRPVLGVHWPSDVLAGWILGATAALLGWWWFRSRDGRNAA